MIWFLILWIFNYLTEHKEDQKYPFIPYGFGYEIVDDYGNKNWRKEEGQHENQVVGSYGFQDQNGIMRQVNYVADNNGFRAQVNYAFMQQ